MYLLELGLGYKGPPISTGRQSDKVRGCGNSWAREFRSGISCYIMRYSWSRMTGIRSYLDIDALFIAGFRFYQVVLHSAEAP